MGAAAPVITVRRGVDVEDPGSPNDCELFGERMPPLRGVFFVTASRRFSPPSGEPSTKSAGLAASMSCAHGLLFGSARSLAARLSLRRSRIPRDAWLPVGSRYSVLLVDVDAVAPEVTEPASFSTLCCSRSGGCTVSGLASICNPCTAGDCDLCLACSSCQPTGVGGIGPNVLLCPGLLVGGAGTLTVCRFTPESIPRPRLCDLDPPGGGPGGGGGSGAPIPQLPCANVGVSSIGVLDSDASTPVETALLAPGALTGDCPSGLHL